MNIFEELDRVDSDQLTIVSQKTTPDLDDPFNMQEVEMMGPEHTS